MKKRPLSVIVIACVYLLTGAVGFGAHISDIDWTRPLPYDALWIELVRLLAVVAGIFMLLGRNWARWLAIAWIAFHVVVGALHGLREFAMHAVICALITWFLFRRPAREYFRATQ